MYEVTHPYLRQAYMLSEDLAFWDRMVAKLKVTCQGNFLALGGSVVVFEQYEDALLFRLMHDGKIIEVNLDEKA